MKISDFKLIGVVGNNALTWRFKAIVTVTTKRFLRKPVVEQREVFRKYADGWYFIDNGEFTPSVVDSLARKLEAEKGKELHECLNT